MLGTKARQLIPVPAVCLDELVPAAHFYRHLEQVLDLTFVRQLVQDAYAANGRPSIDPVVFFKLQLVMFFEGIRSERHLLRLVADRLSVRWYLGYNLDEPLPNHSSLTRIRSRFAVDARAAMQAHVDALFAAEDLRSSAEPALASAEPPWEESPSYGVPVRAQLSAPESARSTAGGPRRDAGGSTALDCPGGRPQREVHGRISTTDLMPHRSASKVAAPIWGTKPIMSLMAANDASSLGSW